MKNIEKMLIPKFPYDGKYLIKKGFSEGKNWFNLEGIRKTVDKEQLQFKRGGSLNIIKRSKKLEIFNI